MQTKTPKNKNKTYFLIQLIEAIFTIASKDQNKTGTK